jgi:hypothetical protein
VECLYEKRHIDGNDEYLAARLLDQEFHCD